MEWFGFLKRKGNKAKPEAVKPRAEASLKKEVRAMPKKPKPKAISAEEAQKAQEKADKELRAAKAKEMVVR